MNLADYNHELYHWGVKGQRWGIRRYQNKDGSLTPLGKKRAAQLEAKYEKVTGKKMGEGDKEEVPKKKTIQDMTDDELRTKTNRLNLEKNYLDAQNNVASAKQKTIVLRPVKEKSTKEKMFEKIGDKLAEEIPKKLISIGEQKLKQMIGLDSKTESELDKLIKENNLFRAREENAKYKYNMTDEAKKSEQLSRQAKDASNYGTIAENANKVTSNAKKVYNDKKWFNEEYEKWNKSKEAYETMERYKRTANEIIIELDEELDDD